MAMHIAALWLSWEFWRNTTIKLGLIWFSASINWIWPTIDQSHMWKHDFCIQKVKIACQELIASNKDINRHILDICLNFKRSSNNKRKWIENNTKLYLYNNDQLLRIYSSNTSNIIYLKSGHHANAYYYFAVFCNK